MQFIKEDFTNVRKTKAKQKKRMIDSTSKLQDMRD